MGMEKNGNKVVVSFDKGGVWEVDQALNKDSIRYTLVKDTSKIGRWIDIKESLVEIIEGGGGEVLVKQTTNYRTKIYPNWYFAPFQKLALIQLHNFALSSWKSNV